MVYPDQFPWKRACSQFTNLMQAKRAFADRFKFGDVSLMQYARRLGCSA